MPMAESTSALPANAGRQPQFISNKSTNSITVRDTPENIRIIEQLLKTVDKDRAEVVMEVAIYELSHNDLLQIGNQLGTVPSDTSPSNSHENQPTPSTNQNSSHTSYTSPHQNSISPGNHQSPDYSSLFNTHPTRPTRHRLTPRTP